LLNLNATLCVCVCVCTWYSVFSVFVSRAASCSCVCVSGREAVCNSCSHTSLGVETEHTGSTPKLLTSKSSDKLEPRLQINKGWVYSGYWSCACSRRAPVRLERARSKWTDCVASGIAVHPNNSTLHFLGSSAIHPPSVKSTGRTVVGKIQGQTYIHTHT